MTTHISVDTAPAYTVTVGAGLLADCGEWLAGLHAPATALLVSDDRVNALYGDTVAESLAAAGFSPVRFVFPHGEASKTTGTLVQLLEFMAENNVTRTDVVVALGGGVVSDLAGFAAAVYLRGIAHVTVPTTLLAAVDAALGGKTGVDLAAGKNLVGAFKQPLGVLCDTDTFHTLPETEWQNGMAEAIKTAVLADAALLEQLKENIPAAVARCVAIKAAIVAEDERDNGRRQLLNLGHTVGHAIERCSGFAIPHGQAVAIGMAVITKAAAKRGLCDEGTLARLLEALQAAGLPTACDYTVEELAAVALHDKKRRGDRLTLAVPRRIGHCELIEIPVEELPHWIADGK